jgi:hypothetical protein
MMCSFPACLRKKDLILTSPLHKSIVMVPKKFVYHIDFQLYVHHSVFLCLFHIFTVKFCDLPEACADCYVLGAIHANSWLLAYGQGISSILILFSKV